MEVATGELLNGHGKEELGEIEGGFRQENVQQLNHEQLDVVRRVDRAPVDPTFLLLGQHLVAEADRDRPFVRR